MPAKKVEAPKEPVNVYVRPELTVKAPDVHVNPTLNVAALKGELSAVGIFLGCTLAMLLIATVAICHHIGKLTEATNAQATTLAAVATCRCR